MLISSLWLIDCANVLRSTHLLSYQRLITHLNQWVLVMPSLLVVLAKDVDRYGRNPHQRRLRLRTGAFFTATDCWDGSFTGHRDCHSKKFTDDECKAGISNWLLGISQPKVIPFAIADFHFVSPSVPQCDCAAIAGC